MDKCIRKITHGISRRIAAAATAAVLVLTGCAPAFASDAPEIVPAFRSSDIGLNVTYGFDDTAKGGRYLGVHVEYRNAGAEDFAGTVCIYSREADGQIYEYDTQVRIPAGSPAENPADTAAAAFVTQTYYIPVASGASDILVRLTDAAGQEVVRREVGLNIERNTAQLFMGILSDTPEKLSYFDNVSVNYGLLRTRCFSLDADSFPEDELGLDLLDIILISNYTIRDLSERQSRVLMNWVRDGGIMVLGTGERVDDTLGRYAPELLADMYEEPESMEIEIMSNSSMNDPGEGTVELTCVDASLRGGNILSRSNGIPVLTTVNKENGLIAVAAYDFADTAAFAGQHSTYAGEVISKILGTTRMEKLAKELYGGNNERYAGVASLINNGDVNRVPPIGLYALSIIAFILLAGPGLYLFLKHRDLSRYYRVGVLCLSLCFTALIYLAGSKTRFTDTFYNYASILDSDEDSVGETTFLNLRDPYNRSYSVSIDPSYTMFPVTSDPGKAEPVHGGWDKEVRSNIRISRSPDHILLSVENVGAFAPKIFRLEKTELNEKKEGFTGEVYLFGNEVEGNITAHFAEPVHNAVLMLYGHMVLLGDMQPEESIGLAGRKVYNIPLSNSQEVAEIVSGLADPERKMQPGGDSPAAAEQAKVLRFYRDSYMKGYTADARVMAFSASPREDGEERLIHDDLEGNGIRMLTGSLPCDSSRDALIYRSALARNPVVISGAYNMDTNTMGTGEPAVLEYQIGNDLLLADLIFEWPEEEYFTGLFEGLVALYNYATGEYDYLDTEKTVYSREDLSSYLTPSGTLTVRYTYRGNASEVALPLLSMTGTEE